MSEYELVDNNYNVDENSNQSWKKYCLFHRDFNFYTSGPTDYFEIVCHTLRHYNLHLHFSLR